MATLGIPMTEPEDAPPAGRCVVAIAASAGGPAALAQVLGHLHDVAAPVLVVQHIQAGFLDGLITWMDRISPCPVRRAAEGEQLQPGVVYFGPPDMHLKVGSGMQVVLDPEPRCLHRPSANELLFSVAQHCGRAGIGIILTGMGDDGALGLLEMRRQGCLTIAQDQQSCAVFGMPKAAQLMGAASRVLPLTQIALAIKAAAAVARG